MSRLDDLEKLANAFAHNVFNSTDRHYIAAVSPDVVLKLIAVARAAAETCACGARGEDPHGFPHVVSCPVGEALAAFDASAGPGPVTDLDEIRFPDATDEEAETFFAALDGDQGAAADRLRARADLYEKDGQAGPLGFNQYGWRQIAEALRREAGLLE